ncbi:hypothetical protein Leryth_018344 [Lithospermum erythrorhizon]|nr:hypothetical protein Leryth_018344 [Lithospermum erythrorhizon]
MSSDTMKENASVVDSSLSEWKIDKGCLAEPEDPCYRANEDTCRSGAEEKRHSSDDVGASSDLKKNKPYKKRYFIIKSLNHQNIELSVRKGIWATQVVNEPILDEAFHNSRKVILIFSVNMSGFFQGYAQMTSSVGWRQDSIWNQGSGGNNRWGHSFKVKWLCLNDLPFEKTLHLKNPLNQYKPVKISRDCQELPQDIGEALCELIDRKDVDVHMKRDDSYHMGPSMDLTNSFRDFTDNPSGQIPLNLYPALLYQNQAEASIYHLARQRPSDTIDERLSIPHRASEAKRSKNNGRPSRVHVDQEIPAYDAWGFSSERSPLTSTITEDDILDMTYEEYLEAHSRGDNRLFYHSSPGPQRCNQKSDVSKESSDDSRRKRSRQ